VTRSEYFRDRVSRTFHGRDIFAPVAAHLSMGLPLEKLGKPFADFERGSVARPVRSRSGITGVIIAFDRFGNGVTNIPAAWLEDPIFARTADPGAVLIKAGGRTFGSLSRSYLDVGAGEPLVLAGSADSLEIAVNRGSARLALGLKLFDPVEVLFQR
jgi:S-adenosylmethionine hydrolase